MILLRLLLALTFTLLPWLASAQVSLTDGTLATSNTAYERGRGGAPSVNTCGGGSPSVAGTDGAGVITVGTGAPAACTLAFSATYSPAPFCQVIGSATTAAPLYISSLTTTVMIVNQATALPALVYYQCSLP